MKRAVITGMGVVSPLGNNLADTLASLKETRSGIKFQEAYDLFQSVADRDPLLRHRAMTGLAMICSRIPGAYSSSVLMLAWHTASRAASLQPPSSSLGTYIT